MMLSELLLTVWFLASTTITGKKRPAPIEEEDDESSDTLEVPNKRLKESLITEPSQEQGFADKELAPVAAEATADGLSPLDLSGEVPAASEVEGATEPSQNKRKSPAVRRRR